MEMWHKIVKKAHWLHFAQIREIFPHADQVGEFTVFNIGGNKYRLIVVVAFEKGKVYVRHVLTHKDYDKGLWQKGN